MIPVDGEILFEIAPRFTGARARRQAEIIGEISPVLARVLGSYAIDTRLRIAHFLGQTCHESAGFRTTEEFASGRAYEGRKDLGNVRRGDGARYKGRGLIQLTGRFNYRKIGETLGIDLEASPSRAAEPQLSLQIACEYWNSRKINLLCDRDDLRAVTRAINGGYNGLQDRLYRTGKAKTALARLEGLLLSGRPTRKHPVLRRGSLGEAVADLQMGLRALGYPLAIDGDFGPATELAVMQFQAAHRLTADGMVGRKTWGAFEKATQKKAA